MEWVKCKVAEMSVRHGEYGERIGKGKVVDLDRVVSKRKLETDEENVGRKGEVVPVMLRDLLRGREECFESASDPSSTAPQSPVEILDPPSPLDVEDE